LDEEIDDLEIPFSKQDEYTTDEDGNLSIPFKEFLKGKFI